MLDHDRLMRFHLDGYLGPLPLAAGLLTPAARRLLTETVHGHGTQARHLDSRLVFQLCTDAAVLSTIGAILGTDLLLWSSSFVRPTAWHQDLHRWPTALTVTAWLILTATGRLEVVPGSHRALVPEPVKVVDGRLISVPAGQFVVLSDRVLHRTGSTPDETWALAARFTAPAIHVPHHRCILVSGSDRFGINKLDLPPAAHTRRRGSLW